MDHRRQRLGGLRALALSALAAGSPGACGGEMPPAEPRATDAPPPALGDPSQVDRAVAARIEQVRAEVLARPDDAETRLLLGMLYDSNGLTALARDTYSQVVGHEPASAKGWYHLGRVQGELGEDEAAADALVRAAALAPEAAWTHWRLGLALLRSGRLVEADEAFARATERAPGDPSGWTGRARVALQAGDPAAAMNHLERALEARPGDGYVSELLARALQRLGRAGEADAARARAEDPTAVWSDPWLDEAKGLGARTADDLERAKDQLRAGRTREAIEVALPIHAAYPLDVNVQSVLTAAWVGEGELDRALAMLEAARAAQPDHYRIEMNLGIVRRHKGELERAIEHLRRAVELFPSYGEAHEALGEVLLEAGAFEAGAESLARAFELGERSLTERLDLGRAQGLAGDWEAAIATFEAALVAYPDVPTPYAFLASAHAERGRLPDARAALAELERRDPNHRMLAGLRRQIESLERASGAALRR